MLDGPFRGSKAIAAGLITPNVLRGPRYYRPLPDVYAPAACEPSLAVRSRAAYLWLDGKGVLGGYSAAKLYAARCAPSDSPAEVVIPEVARRPPPGLIVRRDRLAPDERRFYQGAELPTPVRSI